MRTIKTAVRALRRLLASTELDRPLAAMGWPLPAALRPYADEFPAPSFRKARRRGINFELDPSDFVQWLTYFGMENDQRKHLLSLAGPGATVIDVGASIGDTLLALGQRVGPQGRAIGFEANPETFKRCQRNLDLNTMRQVSVECIGLGAENGQLSFGRVSAGNSGADRFVAHGGTITIPVIPFDEYCDSHSFERIDLIKIDVEGFDLKVLQGAEHSLSRFRPVLFVELCDANLREQGGSAAMLLQWLEQRNYAVQEAITCRPLQSGDANIPSFTDIVCTPL